MRLAVILTYPWRSDTSVLLTKYSYYTECVYRPLSRQCYIYIFIRSRKPQHGTTCCAGSRHNMPLPFDLESGVRVTCDVGYLCANFSLPRPLCSRLRPDVRDRQTDVRQTSHVHHRLLPLP